MTHTILAEGIEVYLGDCLSILKTFPDHGIDSIVTDPPAGIAFMGKGWDQDKGGRDNWIAWMELIARECWRVLKPGGHAIVWSLPRTSHWTATAWENGGFEVRDRIAHIFFTGFPKGHNVGKAIDKMKGVEREVVGSKLGQPGYSMTDAENQGTTLGWSKSTRSGEAECNITAPATPESKKWDGWNTALKPAVEDYWLFRKPLIGTVVENILEYGTGALNIDGCRIEGTVTTNPLVRNVGGYRSEGLANQANPPKSVVSQGRWPSHLIHDGSPEVVGMFPETGKAKAGDRGAGLRGHGRYGLGDQSFNNVSNIEDNGGSAARFFFAAKASKRDRDEGCEEMDAQQIRRHSGGEFADNSGSTNSSKNGACSRNHHPTCKPTSLFRYLCRLITPPNGIVLDPFMGSGSTGKAAILEGFRFIGIEQEPEYVEIAIARLNHALRKPKQADMFSIDTESEEV